MLPRGRGTEGVTAVVAPRQTDHLATGADKGSRRFGKKGTNAGICQGGGCVRVGGAGVGVGGVGGWVGGLVGSATVRTNTEYCCFSSKHTHTLIHAYPTATLPAALSPLPAAPRTRLVLQSQSPRPSLPMLYYSRAAGGTQQTLRLVQTHRFLKGNLSLFTFTWLHILHPAGNIATAQA